MKKKAVKNFSFFKKMRENPSPPSPISTDQTHIAKEFPDNEAIEKLADQRAKSLETMLHELEERRIQILEFQNLLTGEMKNFLNLGFELVVGQKPDDSVFLVLLDIQKVLFHLSSLDRFGRKNYFQQGSLMSSFQKGMSVGKEFLQQNGQIPVH